ncbi:MAG: succinate dehydrogenase, hydrophobic membrane anchor protein [Alteraurantiacibacter sp.]|nr:succinate dehydrogenase, hydrophobic membrane anchor protein [Alteraurantiacibacter sp.]
MGDGTSIGRVRGLGSARAGTHHWLLQRLTAVGNLALMLWFGISLLLMPNLSYQTAIDWISAPAPATAMVLLVISTFWHARLGMQVMIEDYVHGANRIGALIAVNLAAFAGAAFGVLCIIRLALGGA